MRTLKDLKEYYDLDIEKAVNEINNSGAKRVLLQFAEGLKPYATSIVDYLEEKTSAEFFIFLGECYGACDTPVGLENFKFDLLFQFGHNELMPDY